MRPMTLSTCHNYEDASGGRLFGLMVAVITTSDYGLLSMALKPFLYLKT